MNGPNTHGEIIQFPDGSTAFIDGVPDQCEHVWDGPGYHFVSYRNGGGFAEMLPDTGQTQDDLISLDEKLRNEGKYLSGGCVSCSKCGKPYEPEIF